MIEVDQVDRRNTDRPPNVIVRVDGRGEMPVPLSGSDCALLFTAPARILAELSDVLDSLADQAAAALQRISLAKRPAPRSGTGIFGRSC